MSEDGAISMEYEKQLAAMRTVMEALSPLEDIDRKAVWNWVSGQLGLASVPAAPTATAGVTATNRSARQGTVSVVAQKLGVSSARELLLAAAAHLTLYQDKEVFTKDELIACAKEARSWKAPYANQMAVNIRRMCDAGTLFEKTKDVFSLSDESLADVEGRLS
jgi:hypothetical protein